MDVEFTFNGDINFGTGFSLMLVKHEPDFPNDYGEINGFRDDFNGIGIILHKSTKKDPNKWVFLITLYFSILVFLSDSKQRYETL